MATGTHVELSKNWKSPGDVSGVHMLFDNNKVRPLRSGRRSDAAAGFVRCSNRSMHCKDFSEIFAEQDPK